jgi:hypothetical protein
LHHIVLVNINTFLDVEARVVEEDEYEEEEEEDNGSE